MVKEYAVRPTTESAAERRYLERRLAEVERDMGRLAAAQALPTPNTQPLEALGRGRELIHDLLKEVQVRSLDEAVSAHLAWLDRAETRAGVANGEPKVALDRIPLDRRVLQDLQKGWQASRQ
jgi:hypothetical protein